jgi:hypothetical protein
LQPYVTELDLRHSLVPDEVIDDLIATMPAHKGPDMQEDRNVPKYDYITYMERYGVGAGGKGTANTAPTTQPEHVNGT